LKIKAGILIMANRDINCIIKSGKNNGHEAITHIGGDWGKNGQRIVITKEQAIWDIENHLHIYHAKVGNYDTKVIEVHLHTNGRRYLSTVPDHTSADNLLWYIDEQSHSFKNEYHWSTFKKFVDDIKSTEKPVTKPGFIQAMYAKIFYRHSI
jgi:hypothetical protein